MKKKPEIKKPETLVTEVLERIQLMLSPEIENVILQSCNKKARKVLLNSIKEGHVTFSGPYANSRKKKAIKFLGE